MIDLGTVRPGSTIRIPFSSFDKDDGSSITMTNFAAADILAYKDGGTTERASTAGYTATTDFDTKTGKHLIVIDLADDTTADFWKAGSEYLIAIDAVTIDAVTVGGWVARFRIGYPNALWDTSIATLSTQTSFTLTAGPAEDDALNGMWAYIHDKASAVQCAMVEILDYVGSTKTVTLAAGATFTVAAGDNISIMGVTALRPTTIGRTLDVSTGGEAGVDWANVGSPTTTVGLSGTTVKTATDVETDTADIQSRLPAALVGGRIDANMGAISSDSVAADNAESFFDGTGYAGTGNTIPTVTTLTNAPSDSSGVTTLLSRLSSARAGYLDNLSAGAVALASTFTGITSLAEWLGLLAGKQTGNSTARTELRATGAGSGTFDETTDSQEALRDNTGTAGAGLTAVGDTRLANLDATVSSRLASASYTAPPSAAAVADQVWDEAISGHAVSGSTGEALSNASAPTAAAVADAVWDELLSGHAVSGSAGEALSAAGTAGDPWTTALPGAYGAGTAGKIIGDNINATISSRASQTSLDAVDDYVDTEISAIKTKTDNLPASPAATSDIPSASTIAAAVWDRLTSALTTVGSIGKLLVDNIDAAISSRLASASYSAPPSAAAIADQVWDEAISGHAGVGSTGEALSNAGAAGTPPTAAAIADAVWDELLSGHAISGSAGDTLGNVATGTPPTAAAIADAVWDEAASGHVTAGSFGANVADILTDTGTTLQADLDNLQTRVPAALVGGRMDASVGAMASGVVTAAAIASDAITDAKVAADVTIASVTGSVGSVTGNVGGSVGSVTGAVGSVTGNVGGNVVGSVGSLASQAKADVNAEVVDALTVDLVADSVAPDGSRPTIAQALYMLVQHMSERSVSGTTVTVKKPDGSTTLMTFTLDDATTPTSITRTV